jgi:hypothetical protein
MAGQVANVCWLADDRYVVSAGGHDRSLFQWKVVDPTGDGALVRPHNDAPCPPFTSHGASIAAPDSQPRVVARSERRRGRADTCAAGGGSGSAGSAGRRALRGGAGGGGACSQLPNTDCDRPRSGLAGTIAQTFLEGGA